MSNHGQQVKDKTMTDQPFKPCPCCGAAAEAYTSVVSEYGNYGIYQHIRCSACDLTTDAAETLTEAEAVWNRRPETHPTDADLAALRALHEAATPGPWKQVGALIKTDTVRLVALCPQDAAAEDYEQMIANAAYIAAACTAVPHLVAEVARLRKIAATAYRVECDQPGDMDARNAVWEQLIAAAEVV